MTHTSQDMQQDVCWRSQRNIGQGILLFHHAVTWSLCECMVAVGTGVRSDWDSMALQYLAYTDFMILPLHALESGRTCIAA